MHTSYKIWPSRFASFNPSCMCNTHSNQKHTNNTSLSNNLVYSILIKKHTTNTSLQQLTTYCTTWPSTHEACPRWRPLVHFGHRREILSCQLGRFDVFPVLLCCAPCFTMFYSILFQCGPCLTMSCSIF